MPSCTLHSTTTSSNKSSSSGEGKRPPPPPPRRLTPPREEANLCRSKVEKDLQGNLVHSQKSDVQSVDHVKALSEIQLAKELPLDRNIKDQSEEHPLRILSEENLTVVSSFRGSVNDLEDANDHDQVDPSKLSFFRIPDFGQITNPACNDMIRG